MHFVHDHVVIVAALLPIAIVASQLAKVIVIQAILNDLNFDLNLKLRI